MRARILRTVNAQSSRGMWKPTNRSVLWQVVQRAATSFLPSPSGNSFETVTISASGVFIGQARGSMGALLVGQRQILFRGLALRYIHRRGNIALIAAADSLDHVLAGGQIAHGVAPLRLADDHEFQMAVVVLQLHKRAGDRFSGRVLHDALDGGIIFRRPGKLGAEE